MTLTCKLLVKSIVHWNFYTGRPDILEWMKGKCYVVPCYNHILTMPVIFGIEVYQVFYWRKKKVQTDQNKIVRYIHGYDCRQHLNVNDFEELKMLKVDKRVEYTTLCHMFNVNRGTAPTYMCNMEKVNHQHRTRSNCEYVLPSVKTQGKKSFYYNGVKLWNNLAIEIRNVETKELFKVKLKDELFDRMRKEEDDDFILY